MGTFNSSKCVNKNGTIKTSSATDIVDIFGTIRGAAQFDGFSIVDIYGDIGKIAASGPWEMQKGTAETVSTDMGTISNNYVNAGDLTNFTSAGCTGYMAGNISGTGTFTIKNGPQTIGGVSYAGNGITIFTGTISFTGTLLMETGTTIKLGADCTNAVTKLAGGLNIGSGATCTQYNGFTGNTYLCQAFSNTGIYNIIGCGTTCGVGGVGLATTVANNGVINIDKCAWRNFSTWSGTGTVNVLDGGTLQLVSITIGSTTTVNINGCGWCDANGNRLGALNITGTGTTWSMKINVQTASCITTAAGSTGTLSGVISGSAPLTLNNNGSPKPNGITHISNVANTYNGTITVDGTNLNGSYGNSLQYASIVLINGARISSSGAQTIGSLASDDPTTYWTSSDALNHIIKANGITTFAGRLLWNGGSNTANYYLEGGSSNQLTLTGTGNTGNMYARNGSKLILQGATFTGTNGQLRIQTGSTVSAGTSTTSAAVLMYIDATSALDVRAAGSGTGIMNIGTGTSVLSNGWKVNALDSLAVGTYPIIKNTGAAITQLPVLGTNNTGHSVSFVWNNAVSPKTLNMIVS
jgi:hypothetical protein